MRWFRKHLSNEGPLAGSVPELSRAELLGELLGDRPLLGRMKELVSYWKELPGWRRRWALVKVCSSAEEFFSVI